MAKGAEAIQLVYRHPPGGGYEVLYFFSDAGPVPAEAITTAMQELFQRPPSHPLSFAAHEELKDFALGVCQVMGSPEVSLLPVQDYNIGVEAARDRRAFRELFRRYGLNIPNPEVIQRPGSLMKRLFKK